MSADRPDDFDDPDREVRLDYDDRYPPPWPRRPAAKPGFGFWMSVVWCLLYVAVTQIIAGIVFGILIFGIALAPEFRQHGMDALRPDRFDAWMHSPDGRAATLLLVSATQFTGLALSWLLLRIWCGRGWKRKIALTRRPTGTHAALVLIGFPALIGLGAAIDFVIERTVPSLQDVLDWVGFKFQFQGANEVLPDLIGGAPWHLAIFAVAISPAICEEVFCRGFLAQGMAGRYRTWAVVLFTSFLFGCLHLDPRQGLGAMLLGAAIHGAYVATRSLWVAMFVHFANNGLAVVHFNKQLFPVLDPVEHVFQAQPALFVTTATLLFVAVAYALYQTRCKLAPAEPGMPAWEPPGVSGVELPPPRSGTVVTHDPLSPLSVALVLVGAVQFGLVLAFA